MTRVAHSTYVIDYRAVAAFEIPAEDLWRSIEHGDRFEAWWPWLREFRLDGGRLRAGAVLHGVVSPPVPYTMRLQVVIDRCVAPSEVDATVHGDVEGAAHMRVANAEGGCRVEVSWTIEMRQRAMRLAARAAHPVMRWGHDKVVEATIAGFRRHVVDDYRGGGTGAG